MGKWFGKIGYAVEEDKGYGNIETDIIEKEYYGDFTRTYQRNSYQQISTNDEVTLNNQLSIVADEYSLSNLSAIEYAEINGVKWKVTGIEEQYPRLILSLGGPYK